MASPGFVKPTKKGETKGNAVMCRVEVSVLSSNGQTCVAGRGLLFFFLFLLCVKIVSLVWPTGLLSFWGRDSIFPRACGGCAVHGFGEDISFYWLCSCAFSSCFGRAARCGTSIQSLFDVHVRTDSVVRTPRPPEHARQRKREKKPTESRHRREKGRRREGRGFFQKKRKPNNKGTP